MGKNIISQARGKGGPTYKAPSFRFKGASKLKSKAQDVQVEGTVVGFIKCQAHSAPLMGVTYMDGENSVMVAPEGIRVGETVAVGSESETKIGNVLPLMNIPEGTVVSNIELRPGDGGKLCRGTGTGAKIITKQRNGITIMLPSKKQKVIRGDCRAMIGLIAGGGRTEKPFLKAGVKAKLMKNKNKLYPRVSGSAQNAVDHPFGNKRTSRKSKARPTSKNAPPGRKVGMVGARRTGRKK